MAPELEAADWLEDLAIYGRPRRFFDAETANHLSQAIRYLHLVKLALEPQPRFSGETKKRCFPIGLRAP